MNWDVEQPYWVWVAGVLLALAAFGVIASRRRSWRWRTAGVLLPLTAAAMAALALAGPAMVVQGNRTVILLDLSASTRKSPWRDPAWVEHLAMARLGPDRIVAVVGFNGGQWVLLKDARVGDAQAWPGEWPADSAANAGSNAYAALGWRSEAEAVGAGVAPRWIITDGLVEGWRDPVGGNQDPKAAFPVAYTIVPPEKIDVGVTDVQVRPAENAPDASAVEVMTQIRAVGSLAKGESAAQVTVSVLRDGQSIAEEPMSFKPEPGGTGDSGINKVDASRWITVRDLLPAGEPAAMHRYEVRAKLKGGDPWPENDLGKAVWIPPGAQRILVVGGENQRKDADAFGAGATFITFDQFPANAATLAEQGWQTIVLDNLGVAAGEVGGHQLPGEAGRAIYFYVTGTGGGLLMVRHGRPFLPESWGDFTGNWGYLEDDLSPVSSWQRQKSGLHTIFLLDASASMNEPGNSTPGGESKFKVAAQAVEQAARLLPVEDRLTVIAFHDRAELLADGLRGAANDAMKQKLQTMTPGGATAVDTAVDAVDKSLQSDAIGTRKLVVLLTDGEIPAMDIANWKKVLTAGNTPGKMETQLAIIAPKPSATAGVAATGALQQLADAVAGTKWFGTDDPGAWSALLIRTLAEELGGNVHTTPLPWRAVEGQSEGTAQPWSDAWLKPGATLLAAGRDGERDVPIAAVIQQGLGQVAAIEMGDERVGGGEGSKELLKQLLARIAAPAGDRRFVLGAHKGAGGIWTITADATDERGFLDGQWLNARIAYATASPGQQITGPLMLQTAPGHYETTLFEKDPIVAIVTRNVEVGSGANATTKKEFIGRLPLPEVANDEWPGSVDEPLTPARLPAGYQMLPVEPGSTGKWNPPPTRRVSLESLCWNLAALAALAAMWLRR